MTQTGLPNIIEICDPLFKSVLLSLLVIPQQMHALETRKASKTSFGLFLLFSANNCAVVN